MDGQEKTVMGASQMKHHQKRHGMNADAEVKMESSEANRRRFGEGESPAANRRLSPG